MAYENLLIRERADLADTKEEYDKQIEDRRRLGAEGPGNQEGQGRKEEPAKSAGGIVARIAADNDLPYARQAMIGDGRGPAAL